jgi:hypothetical protein
MNKNLPPVQQDTFYGIEYNKVDPLDNVTTVVAQPGDYITSTVGYLEYVNYLRADPV